MLHLLYPFPEPLPLQKARAIQVVQTVAALGHAGVRVTLAFVPVAGQPDPFVAYGVSRPSNVVLCPLSRSLPGLPWLKSGALFAWRLQRWCRAAQARGDGPDVIFVRHLKLAHRLLSGGIEVPLMYEAHECFADTAPPKKAAGLAAQEVGVLQGVAQVIAITAELGRLLKNRYRLDREIPILPSATTLPERGSVKDWSGAKQSIVYAGSLYGWKGVDDLVDAAAYLPAEFEISILGGDPASIARLQARQASAGAQIHFRGHVSHADVMETLIRSCIAVLPNRAGSVSAFTSPLKLFEAMAAGCALVVSDLPVFREVLCNEDAVWFEAGNPQALAQAIQTCLNDPIAAAAAGARVREQAKQFSWAGRAERIKTLMDEMREKTHG